MIYIIYMICMPEYSDKVISQARKTHGYLYKKSSGLISIWQRRYFIILQDTLTYYADEALVDAKKQILIQEVNYIKFVEQLQFQLVTKKRVYELRATDQSNRDLWAASLNILINYKEWNRLNIQRQMQVESQKESGNKKQSRTKKSIRRPVSPQQQKKHQSTGIQKGIVLQTDCTPQQFLESIKLVKLAQAWKLQQIYNKAILIKEAEVYYFIVSCKSLVNLQDEDLLSRELIRPYDFNCLYSYECSQIADAQVRLICKCCEIQQVEEQANKIRLVFSSKQLLIRPEKRFNPNVGQIIAKIKHAILVGREYHNGVGIHPKRNIDQMLSQYDQKQAKVAELAKRQLEKAIGQSKESNHKQQFRRNMDTAKKILKQIMDCCDIKTARKDFKVQFIRQYHELVNQYLQNKWDSLQTGTSSMELKKLLLTLFDFWKLVRGEIVDDRMFEAAVALQKTLLNKYQNEINCKIDSCFSLTEKQILGEVSIEINGEEAKKLKLDTLFYSNNIYRQFHLDIRLLLFEFPEMAIHQKTVHNYLALFSNTFRHLCEKTFKELGRWKDSSLILGTCNEIQFIKNSLFEEILAVVTKQYDGLKDRVKNQHLRELETEISNIEIILVKKLFVLTFSDIDRNILNKPYDELDIKVICDQITGKMKKIGKINKYVRRNLYEASFEQVCYFYYSSIIKFNKKHHQPLPTQFFINKMADDFAYIAHCFQADIQHHKIYTHLKDLALIKHFLECDLLEITSTCKKIKKEFGNSFTETAFKNLLNLRNAADEIKQNIMHECEQIVKNSADSPEQMSLISSSRESFLQNWNNTRSRKSTLTLSLNQFMENQQLAHNAKQNDSKFKQGYLYKKNLLKNTKSNDIRSFFKISQGDLLQYEFQTSQQPVNKYELQFIKKCYLHPEKPYIFIAEFPEVKLQFKCDTTHETKQWIKNIYEEISCLSVILKQKFADKDRQTSEIVAGSFHKDQKQSSTMQSYPKAIKDKSLEKSTDIVSPRKTKNNQTVRDSAAKSAKGGREKDNANSQCGVKCSVGFFF